MSSWRLPRPVVGLGAKRIRRGSSVRLELEAQKTSRTQQNSSLTSLPLPLPLPLCGPNNLSLSLSLSLFFLSALQTISPSPSLLSKTNETKQETEKSPSPVAVAVAVAARIMSAAAAAEVGKEKGAATPGPGPGPGGACELCGAAARVYCGADEATLCWGCDAQVHGANFLVARHARSLLCRGCARPTPWRAAGPRLGPTVSLCVRCVRRGPAGAVGVGGDEEMGGAGDGDAEDDDDEDDDSEEEEEEEEEEGEGENQVVPWTEDAEATPPPVGSSTSSSSREAPANGAERAAKVPPLSPLFLHPLLDLPSYRFAAIQFLHVFPVNRGRSLGTTVSLQFASDHLVLTPNVASSSLPGKRPVLHLAARPVPPRVVRAPRRPERRGHLVPERRPGPRLPPQEEIALGFLQL
jgi:hypothetical protein